MAGPFKAVIFDLDDTLFDCTGTLVEASRRRAAEALVEAGLPLSVSEAFELQRKLAEEKGPRFLVLDEIADRYDLGREAIKEAYRAYNSDEVEDIRPFDDVIPTLRSLRDQGILCLLLTSGLYRRQSIKVEKLGLEDEFDEILINDLERGILLGECIRYLLDKYHLKPHEVLVVGDRPQEEIRGGKESGTITAQMLHGKFKDMLPRDEQEVPDYKINRIFQVPTLIELANLHRPPEKLKVVALGGGTGLPIVLEGCKPYSRHLSAIVAVTDSGRSSGRLREELGMLPPGDARNCLVALSEAGHKEQQLNKLFQYRFRDGSFEGMSLGNLIIAAMTDMEGDFESGIRSVSDLLNLQGKVLPPTVEDCHVCARLENGTVLEQEVNVRALDKPAPIEEVFLQPRQPRALDEAEKDLHAADIIVLGPGSLYTSIITNLLVPGIRDAVAESDAKVFYVCNIMTQPGQTDGFDASTHLRELAKYLGEGVLDGAVFNSVAPPDDLMKKYRNEGAELVDLDGGLDEMDVDIAAVDLLEELESKRVLWEKQDLLRHDPDKLGDALCRLYAGMQVGRRQSAGTLSG